MGKTIKIIDLANKIAKGKKVPQIFIHNGQIWKFDEFYHDYKNVSNKYLFRDRMSMYEFIDEFLNLEVWEDDNK